MSRANITDPTALAARNGQHVKLADEAAPQWRSVSQARSLPK